VILAAAILASSLGCSPSGARDLLGFWESEDTTRGGIGHTLEFKGDGSVLAAAAVLVNMAYRVSGNRLVVDQAAPGDTIRIEGDRLWQTSQDGSVVEKRRVKCTPSAGQSLVGVWTFRHYTGAVAYERYTEDGQLQFRLALSSHPGCYSASSGQLTMTWPKASTEPYVVEGDRLTLKVDDKEHLVYRRVPGGAWYPRHRLVSQKGQ
jgi:hypothetical protein